jgi:hypothetical protein
MPGQPAARQQAARQLYFELSPGRSLAKLLEELKKRWQSAGKPQVTTRLQTLEKWCSEGHWTADAIQYDADCAARRAEYLHEEARRQAEQDIKLLAQTLRGRAAVSAVILSTYTDKNAPWSARTPPWLTCPVCSRPC